MFGKGNKSNNKVKNEVKKEYKIKNLANKLTVARIIMVIIMILVAYIIPVLAQNVESMQKGLSIRELGFVLPYTALAVLIVFTLAAITDKLDGYIARKRNEITTFGKFLDPIADKILVLAAMIILVEWKLLPAWIPIIILFREFIVSGYRLVAAEKGGEVIAASIWGKIKTVTQVVAIFFAFLSTKPYWACFNGTTSGIPWWINLFATVFMTIAIIATIGSGADYLYNGRDLFREKK